MAVDLRLLFEKHGLGFLEAALGRFVGLPAQALSNDALYCQRVATPAWETAPMQFRLVSRAALDWDLFFLAVRERAFDASGGRVALRADWQSQVQAALAGWSPPATPGEARLPDAGANVDPLPAAPRGAAPPGRMDQGTTK